MARSIDFYIKDFPPYLKVLFHLPPEMYTVLPIIISLAIIFIWIYLTHFSIAQVIKDISLRLSNNLDISDLIKKPTLIIYGEKDEYAWGNVPKIIEILKTQKPKFEYKIVKNADHSLNQHQKELGKLLINWFS